jgi:hypothetical protein
VHFDFDQSAFFSVTSVRSLLAKECTAGPAAHARGGPTWGTNRASSGQKPRRPQGCSASAHSRRSPDEQRRSGLDRVGSRPSPLGERPAARGLPEPVPFGKRCSPRAPLLAEYRKRPDVALLPLARCVSFAKTDESIATVGPRTANPFVADAQRRQTCFSCAVRGTKSSRRSQLPAACASSVKRRSNPACAGLFHHRGMGTARRGRCVAEGRAHARVDGRSVTTAAPSATRSHSSSGFARACASTPTVQ